MSVQFGLFSIGAVRIAKINFLAQKSGYNFHNQVSFAMISALQSHGEKASVSDFRITVKTHTEKPGNQNPYSVGKL
jgi:hypothetical protein